MVLVQCCELAHSLNFYNASAYSVVIAASVSAYLVARIISYQSLSALLPILLCGAALNIVLSVANIGLTIIRYEEWVQLDFAAILPFRAYFPMIGGSGKEDGLSLSLAFLSLSLAVLYLSRQKLYRLIAIISIVGSLITLSVGLSREIYVGLAAYLPLYFWFGRRRSLQYKLKKLSVLAVCGSVGMLALLCLWVSSTHIHRLSQLTLDRSITGRADVWRTTLQTFRQHPWIGVGGFCGPLGLLSHPLPYAKPFTARTFNWLLQVLLQSGILGAFPLLMLVTGTICSTLSTGSFPNKSSATSGKILGVGFISLFIGDLGYTSTVLCPPVMIIVFLMAGAIASSKSQHHQFHPAETVDRSFRQVYFEATIACALFLSIVGIRQWWQQRDYLIAREQFAHGHAQAAVKYLEDMNKLTQCDALQNSAEGLALVGAEGKGFAPESLLDQAIPSKLEANAASVAIQAYRRAISCSPNEAIYHHNLAWLLALLGQEAEARTEINQAIELEPFGALYHMSSGLLFERNNRINDAMKEYAWGISCAPRYLQSRLVADLKERRPVEYQSMLALAISNLEALPDSPNKIGALASVHVFQDVDALALSESEAALTQLPTLSYTWVAHATLNSRRGDLVNARRDLMRALFLDNNNRVALAQLAEFEWSNGHIPVGASLTYRALLTPPISVNASRVSRIYQRLPFTSDDVLPLGLLSYSEPEVNAPRLCGYLDEAVATSEGHTLDVLVRACREAEQ